MAQGQLVEQVDEVGRLSQALSESASMQAEAVRMADQAADKVEEQKKEIEVTSTHIIIIVIIIIIITIEPAPPIQLR